jgi:hypothetical protein
MVLVALAAAAGLLSWTATVEGAAGELLFAATATALLTALAGTLLAAEDLNGSAFAGAATIFGAPLAVAGFAETTATCAADVAAGLAETGTTWTAGAATTAGFAGAATATGLADGVALVWEAGTATAFTTAGWAGAAEGLAATTTTGFFAETTAAFCAGTATTFTVVAGFGVCADALTEALVAGCSTTVGVCASAVLDTARSKNARVRFIRSCLSPLPELRRVACHG